MIKSKFITLNILISLFITAFFAFAQEGDKKDMSSIFPLQRAATEKFRVVGIAGDQLRRVAIVEDTAKKFYPLFKGTYIGLKNGRVVEIMADRVIVEEREEETAKKIILKLRKDY